MSQAFQEGSCRGPTRQLGRVVILDPPASVCWAGRVNVPSNINASDHYVPSEYLSRDPPHTPHHTAGVGTHPSKTFAFSHFIRAPVAAVARAAFVISDPLAHDHALGFSEIKANQRILRWTHAANATEYPTPHRFTWLSRGAPQERTLSSAAEPKCRGLSETDGAPVPLHPCGCFRARALRIPRTFCRGMLHRGGSGHFVCKTARYNGGKAQKVPWGPRFNATTWSDTTRNSYKSNTVADMWHSRAFLASHDAYVNPTEYLVATAIAGVTALDTSDRSSVTRSASSGLRSELSGCPTALLESRVKSDEETEDALSSAALWATDGPPGRDCVADPFAWGGATQSSLGAGMCPDNVVPGRCVCGAEHMDCARRRVALRAACLAAITSHTYCPALFAAVIIGDHATMGTQLSSAAGRRRGRQPLSTSTSPTGRGPDAAKPERNTVVHPELNGEGVLRAILIPRPHVVLALETEAAVFIVFRGTYSPFDWIANSHFLLKQHKYFPGRLHHGFVCAAVALYSPLVEALVENGFSESKPLYLTGHSLGGALALLIGYLFVTRNGRADNLSAKAVGAEPSPAAERRRSPHQGSLQRASAEFPPETAGESTDWARAAAAAVLRAAGHQGYPQRNTPPCGRSDRERMIPGEVRGRGPRMGAIGQECQERRRDNPSTRPTSCETSYNVPHKHLNAPLAGRTDYRKAGEHPGSVFACDVAGVFTFGAPMVGDAASAKVISASLHGRHHRFVDGRDYVPAVPFWAVHSGVTHDLTRCCAGDVVCLPPFTAATGPHPAETVSGGHGAPADAVGGVMRRLSAAHIRTLSALVDPLHGIARHNVRRYVLRLLASPAVAGCLCLCPDGTKCSSIQGTGAPPKNPDDGAPKRACDRAIGRRAIDALAQADLV
eukprot:TRINITY_DN1920_c0_g1_i2.p1 TRINITY_DN1920_c0_g1~~TRINITY_DN1920_c0_g1_i2.p1  ORF type:complete len:895 (-),score=26.83 TRINITY_DN1920_c0_g1_i2:476-3160(-)